MWSAHSRRRNASTSTCSINFHKNWEKRLSRARWKRAQKLAENKFRRHSFYCLAIVFGLVCEFIYGEIATDGNCTGATISPLMRDMFIFLISLLLGAHNKQSQLQRRTESDSVLFPLLRSSAAVERRRWWLRQWQRWRWPPPRISQQ